MNESEDDCSQDYIWPEIWEHPNGEYITDETDDENIKHYWIVTLHENEYNYAKKCIEDNKELMKEISELQKIINNENMKPSQQSCPKCGSERIHRIYYPKDSKWDHMFSRYDQTPCYDLQLVRVKNNGWGNEYTAKEELIHHHCQECQFDWVTNILKGNNNL